MSERVTAAQLRGLRREAIAAGHDIGRWGYADTLGSVRAARCTRCDSWIVIHARSDGHTIECARECRP